MPEPAIDYLHEDFIVDKKAYRKALLPLWIKIFAWIFLIFGLLTMLALAISLFTNEIELSIYGIEANTPFSVMGTLISAILIFKGIVAYGLLKQQDWAVNFAIIDAMAGIVICIIVMVIPQEFSNSNMLRAELVALIPFLIKLLKIKDNWQAVS